MEGEEWREDDGEEGDITLLKVHTAQSLQVFYCKCVWKCGCV